MKSTVLDTALIAADATRSHSGIARAVAGVVGAVRKAVADRALYRQLAEMDDVLLRDIGLADDEIFRVRSGVRFIPRAWN